MPTASELLDSYATSTYLDGAGGSQSREDCAPNTIAALRAVLDLHQAEPGQHPDYCWHDKHQLPCPTIRAITAALEAS